MNFKKYLSALGAAIVVFNADHANAARINISGTLGSDTYCFAEGPPFPPDFRCQIQLAEGGSFTTVFDIDEQGQFTPSEEAPGSIRLNFFDKSGGFVYTDNLLGSTLNFKPSDGALSISIYLNVYDSSFNLNFEPSANQNFGNFISGFYANRAGASRKTSQSINIVSVKVTRTPPVKIPESSTTGLLLGIFGIGILLKRRAIEN